MFHPCHNGDKVIVFVLVDHTQLTPVGDAPDKSVKQPRHRLLARIQQKRSFGSHRHKQNTTQTQTLTHTFSSVTQKCIVYWIHVPGAWV